MKQLFKLRKQKKEAVENAKALLDIVEKEERDFTEDEQAQYDEYVATSKSLNKRIERMEALEEELKTLPTEEGNALEISDNSEITGGEPVIAKDPKRGFSSLGEFANTVYQACDPSIKQVDERLRITQSVTGMSMGTSASGGYLTPPAWSNQIYEGLTGQPDNFLNLVDVYTVDADRDSLSFPVVDESTHENGAVWGGARAYWKAEGAQLTASKPALTYLELKPIELTALVYTTNKLLRNSTALDQFITRAATNAINFKIGQAIVAGAGTTEPTGVLEGDALISVDRESGQTAATFTSANFMKMWSRFAVAGRNNAVVLVNQEVEEYLPALNVVLTDVGGTTTVGGFSSAIYNAERNTIKGKPVITTEYCSAPGTAGDIILFDPKAYAVGIRGGVDTSMSMHLRFDYNESVFKFVFEMDGKPWLSSALTPLNGTNTVSPYVTMASDDVSA